MQKVVIVGGGFGGIKAALELARDRNFSVTLLSERQNFLYYPGLYHTATGGRRVETEIPLNRLFDQKGVELAFGKATTIDRKAKTIHTEDGQLFTYDAVIFSLGSVTNYFGIDGLDEYSYGIKSIEEGLRFKKHLHDQLTDTNAPDKNYVIVGGGPTGIELAGNLQGYITHLMQQHGIKHRRAHVTIVEANPKLLPRLPHASSMSVKKRLQSLGVKVLVGQKVERETADSLIINGKPLKSHTVVWTAGVSNNPFFKDNEFSLSPRGKVIVDDQLQAEENIYVIGDNAETMYSGMAQTALHDALFVTSQLKRIENDEPVESYVPKQPITIIPVGLNWAVVIWGKMKFAGIFGWWLRQSADLIAFKDVEPWWDAGQQFITSFGGEESCPICK